MDSIHCKLQINEVLLSLFPTSKNIKFIETTHLKCIKFLIKHLMTLANININNIWIINSLGKW